MNYLVKCKFCPAVTLVYYHTVETKLVTEMPCYTYNCPACKSSFFYQNERLMGWLFVIDYKDYRFYVTWLESKGKASTIIEEVSLSRSNEGFKKIVEIDGATNLTPHNILQKLPTILTFS